ncbi:MAG: cysteine peptidase family C39 domain-containing protein [Planctomycetota bacterium]|jgi:predicted double-glycine peptidase
MFWAILCVLLAIGAPFAGWWISGKEKKVWMTAAVVSLAALCSYPLLSYVPAFQLSLYPLRSMAYLDDIWPVPWALFFLALGMRQVEPEKRLMRGAVVAMGLLAGAYILFVVGWFIAGAPASAKNVVDQHQITRQSTTYTCAAAATATLCRRFGVEITEQQACEEVLVLPMMGASPAKVAWAVRDLLGERAAAVEILTGVELAPGKVPVPCLAEVIIPPGINHLLVLRDVDAESAYFDDPLNGRTTFPIALARERWTGVVIAVTPK